MGRIKSRMDLVKEVARATNREQYRVKEVMQAYEAAIARHLECGDSVGLSNFGVFGMSEHAERNGRNPQTGAVIRIPARRKVRFQAAKALKKKVNR